MTCSDCAFFNHCLFPVCFIFLLFCFVSFPFAFCLNFDIFSGTHMRTCVQVATPLLMIGSEKQIE